MSSSKTPQYDAAVKKILDAAKPGERVCELTGEKWMMDGEEIGWYKKFNVPPSKRHPDTRNYIMTCFWLTFSWWWNKHWKTGERVFTYVHPATGVRVLPDNEWHEEDFISEGRDMDYQRPFFDQFRDLRRAVPLLANRHEKEPHRSVAMFSQGDVDSYFVMFSRSRNSFFATGAKDVEQSAEIVFGDHLTRVFNCVDCERVFDSTYVRTSQDCMNCDFIFDCRNCEYCFGAWNKRNKKYLWWNEQLSQGEWKKRRSEVDLGCRSVTKRQFERFQKVMATKAIWPENFNEKVTNSTGEYIDEATNIHYGFVCTKGTHDSYRVAFAMGDSYECAFSASSIRANHCYAIVNCPDCSQLKFCDGCQSSQNLEYCIQCFNCEDCFGCVGLNRKRFCILNKQYTEEDYWQELDRIKTWMLEEGWYGAFFPASLSINPFPSSGAGQFLVASETLRKQIGALTFGESEEGALGFSELDPNVASVDDIPDCIDDLTDEMIGKPFFDEASGRQFAFLKPEVRLYREQRIAPPNRHYMSRLTDLGREFNSLLFRDVHCRLCHKAIMVSFNSTYPDRIIYCKPCYLTYLESNG